MAIYTGPSANQGSVMGPADTPYFIPESWIPSVIRARARMFNLANQTIAAPFSGQQGDTFKMPYVGRLQTRRKTTGNPFVFESRSEGELKMLVDRYTYAGFALDRKLTIQSHIAAGPEYTKSIGEALAEDIEYSLLAERATFMSYSTDNVIQSASPLAYADMLAAWGRAIELDTNPSNWTWNLGPLQYTTLFNTDHFTKSVQYNSGNTADIPSGAIVGDVFGAPVVLNQSIRRNSTTGLNLGGFDYQDTQSDDVVLTESPGLSANGLYWPTQYGSDRFVFSSGLDTGVTANYHSALLLHKNAIMLAVQLHPEITSWYDNNYGEMRYLGSQIYDIKVKDPQLGIVIETDEEDLI